MSPLERMTRELCRSQRRDQELLSWRRALILAREEDSDAGRRCARMLARSRWVREQIAEMLTLEGVAANDP